MSLVSSERAFILDLNKCTGCQACQVACGIENELPPGESWRWIDSFNKDHIADVPLYHLSLACNHCADPPCMNHCPALAIHKDPITGAVTIDEKTCIGCKYCTWACPYDAARFDSDARVVKKCTLCSHRLSEGLDPACVTQCPTGALRLGERGESIAEPSVAGFPETEADPAIRFIPLRENSQGPEVAGGSCEVPLEKSPEIASRPPRFSLRSEWPLLVFTLQTALLAAIMGAPAARDVINPFAFLIAGGVGAGLSTLHLGKKHRAWRAIANWRGSWLSREIILYSCFLLSSAVHLLVDPAGRESGLLASLFGFATLFAMDRVYYVTRTPGLRLHSAQVLLTGALFCSLLIGPAPLFTGLILLKTLLYSLRKIRFARSGRPVRPLLTLARVAFGFLLPVIIIQRPTGALLIIGGACLLLAELIDRAEFYLELEILSPRAEIAKILRRKVL